MNTVIQPTLPAVHAPSLVEHVYKHLRSRIISGYIMAGTRLIELELATQMHVSQGSTREALGRLERDGLVERKERRGTFVTAVSPAEMREIFALRAYVERFAVHRVVGFVHNWQVRKLESVLTAMREARQHRNRLACVEHDHSFHQHIVQWANHATLLLIWRPLSAQIQRFILTTQPSSCGEPLDIVTEHSELVEVLRGGDANNAARRFEQHVLDAWTQFEIREYICSRMRKGNRMTHWQRRLAPYLFISPFFIGYGVFFLYPVLWAFYLSFFQKNGALSPAEFVGMRNYAQLLSDSLFIKALINTTYYALASIFLIVSAAIGLALVLNRPVLHFREFFDSCSSRQT